MSKQNRLTPIQQAVKKASGAKALSELLGVHVTYVYRMVRTNHVPVEQCKAIEESTGVSRELLRPDIYA